MPSSLINFIYRSELGGGILNFLWKLRMESSYGLLLVALAAFGIFHFAQAQDEGMYLHFNVIVGSVFFYEMKLVGNY